MSEAKHLTVLNNNDNNLGGCSGESEQPSSLRTGLAEALLPEIATLVGQLARTGDGEVIDLRSLPMTDADRDELAEILGRGEVSMTLSVAGESELWETSYPGVWWVRHRGVDGAVLTDFVEVAKVPLIAVSQQQDIKRSQQRLAALIESKRQPRNNGETLND